MQIANFFNPRTKSKDIKAERVAGFPLLMSPPLLWLFIDVSGCAKGKSFDGHGHQVQSVYLGQHKTDNAVSSEAETPL